MQGTYEVSGQYFNLQAQAIMMILLIILTGIFQRLIVQGFHPLIEYLPLTIAEDEIDEATYDNVSCHLMDRGSLPIPIEKQQFSSEFLASDMSRTWTNDDIEMHTNQYGPEYSSNLSIDQSRRDALVLRAFTRAQL